MTTPRLPIRFGIVPSARRRSRKAQTPAIGEAKHPTPQPAPFKRTPAMFVLPDTAIVTRLPLEVQPKRQSRLDRCPCPGSDVKRRIFSLFSWVCRRARARSSAQHCDQRSFRPRCERVPPTACCFSTGARPESQSASQSLGLANRKNKASETVRNLRPRRAKALLAQPTPSAEDRFLTLPAHP